MLPSRPQLRQKIRGARCALLKFTFISPPEYSLPKIFGLLAKVPQDVIEAPRNELVTAAACQLIARSISMDDIQLEQRATAPHWRKIVDVGLRHRSRLVQVAAADAMAAISTLVDCSSVVER